MRKEQKIEVVVNHSTIETSANLAVQRLLYQYAEDSPMFEAGMSGFGPGCHYIFKMQFPKDGASESDTGFSEVFGVELKCGDLSDCYAAAKASQLERFPERGYTGGETIGEVRKYLELLGHQGADSFYGNYTVDDPITVVNNQTGTWLKNDFGLAPWYGGVLIPFTQQAHGENSHGRVIATFSGCPNDQEDLIYNFVLTKRILTILATEWKNKSLLRLQLTGLRKCPAIDSVIRWFDVQETVIPKNDN